MQKNAKFLQIIVRRSPLDRRKGIMVAGPLRLRCALGRESTSVFKREGDGATPVACLKPINALRRAGRLAGVAPRLPFAWTRADSGWCDAPRHAAYNRPVRLPFPASTETLQRGDRLYDLIVVLDWNLTCRARGRGSAIFLHIAQEDFRATEGCIAVSPHDMRRLAPLLSRTARLTVLR